MDLWEIIYIHSFYQTTPDSKLEDKDEKTTNIKFIFKVKFDSDQAALNMKKDIDKSLTGMK